MCKPVSQILIYDRKPSNETPASVIDILELSGNTSEAAQTFKRHWSTCYAGNYVAIRAGYIIGGQSFFPFGASRLS